MQKLRYKSLAVDKKYFCKNVPALTEMQRIFFPHPYLTKLTVALAHCFLEHDRDGEPVFLVLLYFRAVISGVGFVSCGSTHFANMRSEDRTDQLASVRISQHMAAELILGFAIVFAKFAFSSSKLNRIARPRTFHWVRKLFQRIRLEKKKNKS